MNERTTLKDAVVVVHLRQSDRTLIRFLTTMLRFEKRDMRGGSALISLSLKFRVRKEFDLARRDFDVDLMGKKASRGKLINRSRLLEGGGSSLHCMGPNQSVASI